MTELKIWAHNPEKQGEMKKWGGVPTQRGPGGPMPPGGSASAKGDNLLRHHVLPMGCPALDCEGGTTLTQGKALTPKLLLQTQGLAPRRGHKSLCKQIYNGNTNQALATTAKLYTSFDS